MFYFCIFIISTTIGGILGLISLVGLNGKLEGKQSLYICLSIISLIFWIIAIASLVYIIYMGFQMRLLEGA